MRTLALAVLGATLLAGPVLAQSSPHRSSDSGMTERGRRAPHSAPTNQRATSASDRAFNGGGVVLEGPPGAPAPTPQAVTAPQSGTVVQVPASGSATRR